MNNLREVNDDLMKEWFQFREESKFCYLTEEEIKKMTEICNETFVHFIKTSTGFGTRGASLEDIEIINKYKSLPNTKDARNFMRFFLSGATICEFDKQGRINVPKPLIDYAELDKDCIIIGVDEKLEIWSKKRWEEFIAINEENMSEIADSLFRSVNG